MKTLNRRDFLRASAAGFGAAIVSTGITGCWIDDDEPRLDVSFDYGIASGDPMSDRAIIWTKLTVEEDKATRIRWFVKNVETDTVVISDQTTVDASTGHTLKVDATELMAGTEYEFYFSSNGVESVKGRFKTLPEGDVSAVKFAVVSCSNYPAGYFNVYGDIANNQSEIDAVLHLGDYIYEYDNDGYATERAEELGRLLPASNNLETTTLAHYRDRYAVYRSDAQLQACHQNHAFITVWDDHEVTNDSYKDGAENHNEGEGDYTQRKLEALQAYFEWMPIRPASEDDGDYRSYRQFSFGNLVDLMMLDTRLEGRDEQLSYATYTGADGSFDAASFTADVSDTTRTILGADQLQWLSSQLAASNGTWTVLGQQVLMGRMNLPAAIVTQQMSTEQFALVGQTAQIAARQQAGDPTLTAEELAFLVANQALLTAENLALVQLPSIPYNLDAWDGYQAEREVVLETARQLGKNLVVLAGDTHNAWANNLATISGDAAGVEFATASVSSPGLESFFNLDATSAPAFEAGISSLIDTLQYFNAMDRGYLTVSFTQQEATAEWVYLDTVYDTDYAINAARGMTLNVQAGSNVIA